MIPIMMHGFYLTDRNMALPEKYQNIISQSDAYIP